MNVQRWLNFEILLYLLALALAIGIRFYNLGSAPLSETEAEWALQALNIAKADTPRSQLIISHNAGYVILTGVLFALFESTNFLARFWAAIAGSLLVFLPFLLSRPAKDAEDSGWTLGRRAALILAFGLALAPGLVTVSRLAGGPMMALAFGTLALALWYVRRPVLAGVCAGLALLSGPTIILGALVIVLAWIVMKLVTKTIPKASATRQEHVSKERDVTVDDSKEPRSFFVTDDLRRFLIAAGTAVLVVGTLFLIFPQGLGASAGGLTAFLEGWVKPSGVPASRLLAALLLYELLAIVFFLVFIIRTLFARNDLSNQEDKAVTIFVIAWAVIALGLLLLYPGRQVYDLIWVLVPLWVLAAKSLSEYILKKPVNMISVFQAIFILVLAGLLWYTIASTTKVAVGLPGVSMQLVILLGILLLAGLTTLLVALGWSWDISRSGLIMGVSAALCLYSVSVLWGSAQTRHNQPQELWSPLPAPSQTLLMNKVLNEVSTWNTGFAQNIDIVSTVDSSSLRWALRTFPQVKFVSQPRIDDLPSIVFTHEGDELPSLSASYRGEDFVWWSNPGWIGALPLDISRWFTFREAPLINEKIIMWSRSDLFSDTSMSLDSALPALEEPYNEVNPEYPIIEGER